VVKHKAESLKSLFIFLKYFAFAVVIFVLWMARIDAGISPFAIAFLFASIFLPLKYYVIAPIAFVLAFFVDFSQSFVIANAFAVGIFVVFAIIFEKKIAKLKLKKGADIGITVGAFVVANILFIVNAYMSDGIAEPFFQSIIAAIIGAIFVITMSVLVKAALTRRGKIPWTLDQKICLSIFIIIFALGLGGLENQFFSVHKFISILIILCGVYWFSPKGTLIIAICLGLGRSFLALNLNFVAIYAVLCVVVIGFKTRHPYYSIVALVLADIVLGTYFSAYVVYNIYSIIPILVAVAVFLAVPKKILSFINFNYYSLGGGAAAKNTINQNRVGAYHKLTNLSAVFSEMSNIYKGMITPDLNTIESANLVTTNIISGTCENCPNKANCKQTTQDAEAIRLGIFQMVKTGLERGVVNFLDTPPVMSMKCVRLNTLMTQVNQMIEKTMKLHRKNETMAKGKILMSGMLDGVGQLMINFAGELTQNITFDDEKTIAIKDDLLCHAIVVSDCLITNNRGEYTVNVLIPKGDIENKAIEKVTSKICGHKMVIESTDYTQTAGFCMVTLKTAPRYSVVFGVAQIGKGQSPQNGDTYSVLKISSDKTMMAVCDGMGHGSEARKASTLALSLVENFYKAHFPHEVIMSNVNQLLTITGGETFSALDIAIFNLSRGEVDFIKMGAVDGFIKRDREVEVIEAGSLPLGILDEMQPKITHAVLKTGDYIILVSDGVLDAFALDRFGLANFINNITPKTPQDLADEIMQEVMNRSNRNPSDDSTILVGKFVER